MEGEGDCKDSSPPTFGTETSALQDVGHCRTARPRLFDVNDPIGTASRRASLLQARELEAFPDTILFAVFNSHKDP